MLPSYRTILVYNNVELWLPLRILHVQFVHMTLIALFRFPMDSKISVIMRFQCIYIFGLAGIFDAKNVRFNLKYDINPFDSSVSLRRWKS